MGVGLGVILKCLVYSEKTTLRNNYQEKVYSQNSPALAPLAMLIAANKSLNVQVKSSSA